MTSQTNPNSNCIHTTPKQYGAKTQYAEPEDMSPALGDKDKRFVQEVTGTFLFYARAVDGTMLTALNSLAVEQSNPTHRVIAVMKEAKNPHIW